MAKTRSTYMKKTQENILSLGQKRGSHQQKSYEKCLFPESSDGSQLCRKRTGSWLYPAEIIQPIPSQESTCQSSTRRINSDPLFDAYQVILLLFVPFRQKPKDKTTDSANQPYKCRHYFNSKLRDQECIILGKPKGETHLGHRLIQRILPRKQGTEHTKTQAKTIINNPVIKIPTRLLQKTCCLAPDNRPRHGKVMLKPDF